MAGTFPQGPLSVSCFTDQSADETLGPWIDVRGRSYLVFYCSSTLTTSSGVVTFEEAAPVFSSTTIDPPVFGATTGAYSAITTVNASTFTGGAQVAIHAPVGAYCFVRARISTVIGGGGTVSVGLVAY